MCGIAGFIDYNGTSTRDQLVGMTDSMTHRGPDGSGYEHWSVGKTTIGFGHRRLSIIDLSDAGKQPMRRGKYSIVFNGEIYNYREIANGLQSSNVSLNTQSDTEVILAAYERWGEECVQQFRGMFAFAIFDHEQETVTFFRDRTGTKPLFIYHKDGLLLFASELKAFHEHPAFDKSVDRSAVALYFRYGFVPSPRCIFTYVEKLRPGSYRQIDLHSGQQQDTIYWDAAKIMKASSIKHLPEPELLNEIEQQLREAFEYRMVADVPVGVFLSGGYDSSLVTAMLQKDRTDKINTFTIGFADQRYNEADHATTVANHLGTNHHNYVCTEEEARDIIPDLPYYYDEPFADSSAIPTFLVSKITARSVKVALSSDGGDELFSGYARNIRFQQIHQKLSKIPALFREPLSGIPKIMAKRSAANNAAKSVWWDKMASVVKDPSLLNVFESYPWFTARQTIEALIPCEEELWLNNPQLLLRQSLMGTEDEFNALLAFDYQSTLTNDMLVKVDRASMANSLEGREPMLDHKLYEFLAGVSTAQKMPGGRLKHLLKEITHRYIPAEIMDRPKQGFGVPIHEWLTTSLRSLVEEHCSEAAFRKYGILDPVVARRLVKNMLLDTNSTGNQLWLFLTFQMWCKRWL